MHNVVYTCKVLGRTWVMVQLCHSNDFCSLQLCSPCAIRVLALFAFQHVKEFSIACAGLHPSAQNAAAQEQPLLAVMAVIGDYEHRDLRARLRKAWYPGGSRKALEDCLGALLVPLQTVEAMRVHDPHGVLTPLLSQTCTRQ
jgi:hypothetical protein